MMICVCVYIYIYIYMYIVSRSGDADPVHDDDRRAAVRQRF